MRVLSALAVAALAIAGGKDQRRFPKPKNYNTSGGRKEGVLNVHIVPHTHDDVGWLKTVDEYYYGNQNGIQRAEVQNIIHSVLHELLWNEDRKFIYVEQAFFQRWMENADAKSLAAMQQVVANGQLEFINGGWCMHDEANPGFADMIDQTYLGLRLIKQQFNKTVATTWQIDPFGHSAFQAYAMSSANSGYNGLFFARADYQDINNRENKSTTEMIWAPSPSLGMKGATLAGILHNGYGPPGGFDMAEWSSDSPVMDDPNLEEYNVGSIVDGLVNAAMDQHSKYPGNDVMFTMGSDFNYENANTWFLNLDKIIHYINQDGRVNAFYSTPSTYARAKIASTRFTVKTDDFFPYADGPHAYWTGYFTSRAALKGYVRETSSVFHAAKQIQFATGGATDQGPTNPLYRLERAMGVAQHHDAVAGTEKQAVAYDYARRLAWGRQDADAFFASSIAKMTGFTANQFQGCDLTNVTICPALEAGQPTAVFIYNQQAQAKTNLPIRLSVGLPTGVASYSVFDNTGKAVTAQILPPTAEDKQLRSEYYGYNSTVAASWLAFTASSVPPMGYNVYFIVPSSTVEEAPSTHISVVRRMEITPGRSLRTRKANKRFNGAETDTLVGDQTLTNGIISVTVSGSTGRVSSYANAQTGVQTPFAQDFVYYRSSTGQPGGDGQPSGAYIFRPNVTSPFPVNAGAVTVDIVTGPVVQEARQVWNAWASQVVRLWAGASDVDFEFTIGPIDWHDGWGKEVVSTYSTNLATNGTWWSDSNGRDSMTRIRNYRQSWNLNVTEPIAGNYVPINAFAYTRDVNTGVTLSIVNDRSQGVASLVDGEVEIMVHRRLQHDDYRGVGEPLNETGLDGDGLIVRGIHRVSIDTSATAAVNRRTAVADLMWRPLVRFAELSAGQTPAQWIASNKASATYLTAALPANVHLLTALSTGPNTMLMRLAHSYETNEDPSGNSDDATVSLSNLFAGYTITGVTEMTLPGITPLAEVEPITYLLVDGTNVTMPVLPAVPNGPSFAVTLSPMQIRTFIVNIQ